MGTRDNAQRVGELATDLSRDLAACVEALGDKMTACCGRKECGGECGNEWHGMVPTFEAMETAHAFLRTHAPAIAELQARCEALQAQRDLAMRQLESSDRTLGEVGASLRDAEARCERAERDAERLDYIERMFSGMANRERYLPVQMIWGAGCNGRTLREACDKYMKRDAAIDASREVGNGP